MCRLWRQIQIRPLRGHLARKPPPQGEVPNAVRRKGAEGCTQTFHQTTFNAPHIMSRLPASVDLRAVRAPSVSLRSTAPPKGEPFPDFCFARQLPQRGSLCLYPAASCFLSSDLVQQGRPQGSPLRRGFGLHVFSRFRLRPTWAVGDAGPYGGVSGCL